GLNRALPHRTTSSGPVAFRGKDPVSVTARDPVLVDEKDHLGKSRRGVEEELSAMVDDLISGSQKNLEFMCNFSKINPLFLPRRFHFD
ncbi:hypothetical protein TNCT_531411, partial [Trichonephila clavata]